MLISGFFWISCVFLPCYCCRFTVTVFQTASQLCAQPLFLFLSTYSDPFNKTFSAQFWYKYFKIILKLKCFRPTFRVRMVQHNIWFEYSDFIVAIAKDGTHYAHIIFSIIFLQQPILRYFLLKICSEDNNYVYCCSAMTKKKLQIITKIKIWCFPFEIFCLKNDFKWRTNHQNSYQLILYTD